MRSLSVFVSSTCYDLRQIRADLREFLERSGFDAVLSESNGFPIAPDASILDNCLRAVEQRADIFVLIIRRPSWISYGAGEVDYQSGVFAGQGRRHSGLHLC